VLSKEDNEFACRVGPGTPMGELFRRFWLPAMLPGGSWSPGTTSTPSGDYRGLGSTPIEAALDNKKFCILRNHGLLTVGRSVEESVAWFVMAERVAEVHVKAPNAHSISDEAAALAASTLALHPVGWRMFQWLQRSLVPDRSVVD
jgi:Class II Aldolase and Adducin N-terminal domain